MKEKDNFWDNFNGDLYKEFLKAKAEWKLKQQIIYN